MKKLITYSLLFFSPFMFGQNIFFNSGVNLTKYDYKNSIGEENPNINQSNGVFFEIGTSFNLISGNSGDQKLNLKPSLVLNKYNATGGNNFDNYDWDTQFFGLKVVLDYLVFNTDSFSTSIEGGFSLESLMQGNQKIGGTTYDLTKSEEFGGSFFAPNFGVNVVFNANEDIGISTGINFHNLSSSKTSQNGEKLNIVNTQLAVGIIINL